MSGSMLQAAGARVDLAVALSYFDKKVGPTVFMENPEKILAEEVKIVLNQIFDQTTSEGFFWHSLTGAYQTSLNYYFEIKSEWARGSKEMLMCSLVFTGKLSSEKEHEVLSWMIDFIQKMRSKPEVFKAFYYAPQVGLEHQDSAGEMLEQYFLIQKWMKDLYWSVTEEIRQKTEEEIIASFMIDSAIHETIKKLQKHPVKIENLRTWFNQQNFYRDFDHILITLEKERFIFTNTLGHETYILLVKDVNVTRIPPACVLELFDKRDTLQPLLEHYIQVVGEFFDSYNPRNDNKQKLYLLLAQPRHYNLITELRKAPVPKAKISSLLRQGMVIATRMNILGELKTLDIIDEFDLMGTPYVFLKTDITIKQGFPEYILKALPDQERSEPPATTITIENMPGELLDLFSGPRSPVFQDTSDVATLAGSVSGQDLDENDDDDDDSPFDMIVDEISSKFMNDHGKHDEKL